MRPSRRPSRPHVAGWYLLFSLPFLCGGCGGSDASLPNEASSPGPSPETPQVRTTGAEVNPAEAALQRGLALTRSGDIEGASAAYRKAARLNPTLAAAQLQLGRTLMALSRVGAGRGGNAIGADGGVNLGQDEGVLSEAVTALKRASELAPDDPDTLYWAGRALHVANRPEEALEALSRATTIDPTHGAAWKRIGLVHLETGDIHAARSAFQRSEPLLPEDPGIAFQLGNVLTEDDPEAARDAFRRSVAVDPTFSPAYNGLAGVLGRLGDVEAARQARADFERWRSFMDRTRAVATKANRTPTDKAIQVKAGEMYLAHHAWTQALDYFDHALALDASDPQVHFYSGLASRERGDLERARRHLEEALYLAPNALEIRFELLSVLVGQDDRARLAELLSETDAAADSMAPGARHEYADRLLELGLREEAAAQYRALLGADAEDAAAREGLERAAGETKGSG